MNMSFDRYRAQTYYESLFGCVDFEEFYNKSHTEIENHYLDRSEAISLSASLRDDAKDLYFKGCQSLTESLINFDKRLYSWAIIKAYYSIFYMIKADFALKDYALIRHRSIYYLKAQEGIAAITKGRKGTNRTNYSGDHKSALNYYIELFSHTDKLLSQEIDGMNVYQWMMKKREQVNYQEREFKEPEKPNFLEFIDERITSGDLLKLIDEIIDDSSFLLTFQPEYAPLAIPYKRAILTRNTFISNGIFDALTPAQSDHLNSFQPFVFI